MKKISKWIYDNGLFLLTLFLLIFIPLYPKLPLVDIKNTWVYVRIEDFVVFFALLAYIFYYVKKKVTLNTPLTVPILAFWILGGLATIHGVLLFFPTLANVFPNVALLSYVRHIEYMSVFFIAFAGMRRKDFLKTVIAVLSVVFLAACLYGLGQKYVAFPAFLTMNEEFAKGLPITLSSLSRVPSTFAGHYDFAAYLVLLIPLFAALFFGFRNLILKLFFAGLILLGFLLMFMTVSRVSFFAVLISIAFVLFILKRKFFLLAIPVVLVLGILVTFTQSSLFARFGNTIQEVDVLVNGKTGAAIGNVEYVPASYLYDKDVKVQRIDDEDRLNKAIRGDIQEASISGKAQALLPYELLPLDTLVPLVKASNISNGETLPQGTGYINLSLSPVKTRVGDFYYELSPNVSADEVVNFHGNFLVKRASAYDLSFTTRFQGEWPNAIEAFERNIFFGSGYGSVSLAIDNNFLRMLAEIGLLGTIAFILLLVIVGIYTFKSYKYLESRLAKTFAVGVCAGIIGLSINATLIDVYEASKVAFVLWMLIGITLAVLVLESSKKINLKTEIFSFASSPFAVTLYLGAIGVFLYTTILSQFFTLQDFNVFYHSVACGTPLQCVSALSITNYILGVPGFEPPFVSLYFAFMYKLFWLNQVAYHIVSILFNLSISLLVFFFAKKLFKNIYLSALSGFIFLISASTFQSTSSVSLTGIMASSLFMLAGFLLFIQWVDRKNVLTYAGSVIAIIASLLFGLVGVIFPLLIVSYELFIRKNKNHILKKPAFWIISLPSMIFVLGQLIGMFMQKSISAAYIFSIVWIASVNTVMSIPSVMLGESLNSITSILYSQPLIVQIVLSFAIVASVGVVIYFGGKVKLLRYEKIRFVVFLLGFFAIALLPYSLQKNMYVQSVYFSIVAWCVLLAYIFYGLYKYMKQSGVVIAAGFVGVILVSYSLFQIIQIQSTYKNNHTSSESVKNFLVSIDSLYSNSWAEGEVNFYFIDTPSDFLQISQSQSSLESVLWFVFQNPQLRVHIHDDVDQARKEANNAPNSYIFMFQSDSAITQVPKFVDEN